MKDKQIYLFTIIFFLFFHFFSLAQNPQDTLLANWQRKEADSLWKLSKYFEALKKMEESITIYKKTMQWDNWIISNQKIAEFYIELGQFDSVKIKLENIKPALLPNNISQVRQKVIEGKLALQEGLPEVAQKYFEESLRMYENKFNKADEEKANLLALLGNTYWTLGQKEKALQYYQRALYIRIDKFGKNSEIVAGTYNDIGLLYAENELEKASFYYQEAIDIYEKKLGMNHPKVANLYNNLALLYQKQKNFHKSEDFLKKVLAIRIKNYGEKHQNVAFVKNSLAILYLNENKFELAQQFAQESMAIYQEKYGEKHPELANTYRILASLEMLKNDYEKALFYYQDALMANSKGFVDKNITKNPEAIDYYNADIQLNTYLLKAQALKERFSRKTLKIKDLKNALYTLQVADTLIDDIRQTRKNKEDKIALGKISAEIYEEGISVCLKLAEVTLTKRKFKKLAFYFAEKSKASVLLSALSEISAKQFAGIPDALLEEERKTNEEIAQNEQILAQKPDANTEQKIMERLFALRRKQEDFIKNLEQKYPEYYQLKYANQPIDIQTLQKKLPKNTGIVSYFEGAKNDKLFIFYITSKKFKIKEVKTDSNFVRSMKALRNGIEFKAKLVYTKHAFLLYKKLFAIDMPTENLVIIPDGRLGTVPFEILLTKPTDEMVLYNEMPFLLRKKALSYAYSATLAIQSLQKQNKEAHGGLLIAPVHFENQNLNTLDGTLQETKRLNELFKTKNIFTTTYLYEEASEDKIKTQALYNYRYIHLATHGIVDEENPQLSQIFLNPTSQNMGQKEDGNLFAGEIYNLRCNADLITLSACQTGLGQISKGEGIIGLTRALLYAGAKNVNVSLWSVADQSTSQLMQNFYEEFIGNEFQKEGYAQSLQKAKLKLIQNPEWAEPYFWGAFVLIGF